LKQKKLFDSGPQVIESLFAKSIDIAYVGPGPAINGFLKSEKHDVVILSGAASGGASFIVHPNSQIISADDFAGKRIAAPQIGNTQDVSLRNYLSENGLKPYEKGGSVVVLNIPNPDIYTLFTKGEIDAAWVPEPWATILVQELDGKRLFYEEELWPENKFASVLLIGRQEYVTENPEVVTKWLDSHQQTALVNLEITTDPVDDSIYTFAQRADSLGYLGRDGFSLDGIFFDIASNESVEESK
jgi:NitT/TauT family transport system substrate-binding protein